MYNFFQYVFLSLFVCATGQAAMVSPETPENFSSPSILEKIPLAFRKAKEIYVTKKNIREVYQDFNTEDNNFANAIREEETLNNSVAEKTKNVKDFLSNISSENNSMIVDLLYQIDSHPLIRVYNTCLNRAPNNFGLLTTIENITQEELQKKTNNEIVREYLKRRKELYFYLTKLRTCQDQKSEIRAKSPVHFKCINTYETGIRNYQKFYRKTVQYTINGVGTFVGAAIGCLIGHAVAPKIIKKVTQLSYLKQLTPAKQTKIVKALPWVSRLTGGLLNAGLTFLATSTLVDWGHRTVLGIE